MSNWKDTVMNLEQITVKMFELLKETIEQGLALSMSKEEAVARMLKKELEAQAEISYKVGYDKALGQLADMTEECKQLGRQEVVEWIDLRIVLTEGLEGKDGKLVEVLPLDYVWQEQKEKWGIEKLP